MGPVAHSSAEAGSRDWLAACAAGCRAITHHAAAASRRLTQRAQARSLNTDLPERTWRVTPTSKRIVEDIELLPEVLNKIIEARGCVVQDEEFCGLRSGRRAKDSGQLAPKVRRHQRMLDMSSSVPDIEEIKEARKLIQGGLQGRALMPAPVP